jgi:beta-lactam-binding protein with PASTA domain
MKKRMILAIAVTVLAVCFSLPAQAQQVTIPNVVGMTADQAVKVLEGIGLKAPVTLEPTSNQAQAGKVTKQNPAAGQKSVKGAAVVLTAYTYQSPTVVMPDVKGMTFAQAKAALEKTGLSYDNARKDYSVLRMREEKSLPDKITEQNPAAGARISTTSSITLKGFTYSPPSGLIVPDLRNLTIDKAMIELVAAAWRFTAKNALTARKELDRKVAEQNPAPGTNVPPGTSIELTIWQYKETFLEIHVDFMPEAKTYLLLVRGSAQPYDVVVSYDVPKSVKLAPGQKVVTVLLLNDAPDLPAWKRYRITNLVPVEATMVITDAKGHKNEYKLHLTQANK